MKRKFVANEQDLAMECGIPAETVKEIRKAQLTKGEDYDLSGGAIAYTASGRMKLLDILGVKPAAPESPAADQDGRENTGAGEYDDHAGESGEIESPTPRMPEEEPDRGGTKEDQGKPSAERKKPTVAIVERFVKRQDMFFATLEGKEIQVRIPGKSRDRFVIGLPVPVRRVEGELYELDCRPPAFRGRQVNT